VTFVLPAHVTGLRYYLPDDGESPFEALDVQAGAKVAVALARLEQGNLSNAKGVGEGGYGVSYRLGTWTKQRQQRDIAAAKAMWRDYKRRRKPPAR